MKIKNLFIITATILTFGSIPAQAAIPVYKTMYPYNWIGAEQKVQKEKKEQQEIKSQQPQTKSKETTDPKNQDK